jgi:hypothetical protein
MPGRHYETKPGPGPGFLLTVAGRYYDIPLQPGTCNVSLRIATNKIPLLTQPSFMENMRLNLSAPWDEVKELIKESNVELTDEDLEYSPGREEELLGRLEAKMGRSKQEIKALIESISYNRGIAG